MYFRIFWYQPTLVAWKVFQLFGHILSHSYLLSWMSLVCHMFQRPYLVYITKVSNMDSFMTSSEIFSLFVWWDLWFLPLAHPQTSIFRLSSASLTLYIQNVTYFILWLSCLIFLVIPSLVHAVLSYPVVLTRPLIPQIPVVLYLLIIGLGLHYLGPIVLRG